MVFGRRCITIKSIFKLLKRGIIDENPIFIQLLSLCPLLAVTTSAINGATLGLATTAVMMCSCAVMSMLRKIIPTEVRIATAVIVVGGFVTTIQLLMDAYAPPDLNAALGIFIPLIIVNCIMFARIESFATKNKPFLSAIDALGMGLGFTFSMVLIGIIREFFGAGSFFGIEILTDTTSHMLTMILAPGAFFTLGAIIMMLKHRRLKKEVSS